METNNRTMHIAGTEPRATRRAGSRLGPYLCWAVVFADIGTSVYYAPGILYKQVGLLAGLFVSMTLVVFLLLTLKYAEVSIRFPQGGGVVMVAAQALNPWAGAVGGMFILVDYFLTAAISINSGLQYLGAIVRGIAPVVLPLSVIGITLLGVLNWWGIKDSASVSAVVASVAFAADVAILVAVAHNIPMHAIGQAVSLMFTIPLKPTTLFTGFAGAFLAFSGLESISQLAPVMRSPRRRTVIVALGLVLVTVGITSPLLTIFSTTLLTACTPHFTVCSVQVWHAALASHQAMSNPDRFVAELAAVAGGTAFGRMLEILTAIVASALLVFASNTAIIGAYHVLVALARMRFFPRVVERRSSWRGTPTVAIFVVTAIPILVLFAVRGDIVTLGDMYAFGLLGAFSLTCLSLDVIRWRDRRQGSAPIPEDSEGATAEATDEEQSSRESPSAPGMSRRPYGVWSRVNFYVGILTTLVVSAAWLINLKDKPLATAFGGGVTLVGVAISVLYYRRQRSAGRAPVFPRMIVQPIPNSLLAVLVAGTGHEQQIVTAAYSGAQGRSVIFLYLGRSESSRPRLMQITDSYLYDDRAQRIFSQIRDSCHPNGVELPRFIYSIGGPAAIVRARLVIQPNVVLAEATERQPASAHSLPETVTVQTVDGVRVQWYNLGQQED